MRSSGENRVYKALSTLGSFLIREQYQIGEHLRVDMVITELALACEIDGSQHTVFNSHFYDSKAAFLAAQNRDRRKEELCLEAGLTLVRLDEKTINLAKDPLELGLVILAKVRELRTLEDTW